MNRKVLFGLAGIACALALIPEVTFSRSELALEVAEDAVELMMVVGEQRVLAASDVASFSESTRGIIEVKIPRDGKKMILTAARSGSTSLLLIDRAGNERTLHISVFSKNPEAIEGEINELLTGLDGLTMRRVGPRVFVDGHVPSEGDLQKVERVAALYGGQVACLATVDLNAVSERTNIRLDLTFVGLRINASTGAGISWPGSAGTNGVVTGSLDLLHGGMTASYQIVDQAMPALELAARYGWARIRKRATVMTTSGNLATYEAGGEVNVAVVGSQAAELRTVPYGARLSVLPRLAKEKGIIDLEVEAEVSDLTETTQDVPGRTISKVKTLVHLGLGQSILLGGLDAETESKTKTGIPGLARIPILGFFFGTTDKREDREEGIIIVTPTVIDNVDLEGKRRLEQALEKFENFEGKFESLE